MALIRFSPNEPHLAERELISHLDLLNELDALEKRALELLFVTAVAGLLFLAGCPNETTADGSGEELFSFNAAGGSGTAIYSTNGDNWTAATNTKMTNTLLSVAFER